MRRIALLACVAVLAACSPPPQEARETPAPVDPAPQTRSCNAVEPDLAKAVQLGASAAVAAADLPPELPGGPITPGAYDLTGGALLDGAPAWEGPRAIALQVSEGVNGVSFDWAEQSSGDADRWTAGFHQGPPAQLSYSCGRTGTADVALAGDDRSLRLWMPDPSGQGRLFLQFARRGG